MDSMGSYGFWRDFDCSEFVFYACVMAGLAFRNKAVFETREVWERFADIVGEARRSQLLSEGEIGKLLKEVCDFVGLCSETLPNIMEAFRNGTLHESSDTVME
jgi:hypothetical protein